MWETHVHALREQDELSWTRRTVGVLRRFDIDSIQAPVEALKRHLQAHPDDVFNVHATKMEALVTALFRDYIPDCSAYHCGRSGDGGFDVFGIECDNPFIVQVKRRMTPDATEGVASIREFLGAMLLSHVPVGYFVSTANRFTRGAKEAAVMAVTSGIVSKIELIDHDRLFSILDISNRSQTEEWRLHL
jgi:hypothetical protein